MRFSVGSLVFFRIFILRAAKSCLSDGHFRIMYLPEEKTEDIRMYLSQRPSFVRTAMMTERRAARSETGRIPDALSPPTHKRRGGRSLIYENGKTLPDKENKEMAVMLDRDKAVI